jgi:hypothetical protein
MFSDPAYRQACPCLQGTKKVFKQNISLGYLVSNHGRQRGVRPMNICMSIDSLEYEVIGDAIARMSPMRTKMMQLNRLSYNYFSCFHALSRDLLSFNCGFYAHVHWGEEHGASMHFSFTTVKGSFCNQLFRWSNALQHGLSYRCHATVI